MNNGGCWPETVAPMAVQRVREATHVRSLAELRQQRGQLAGTQARQAHAHALVAAGREYCRKGQGYAGRQALRQAKKRASNPPLPDSLSDDALKGIQSKQGAPRGVVGQRQIHEDSGRAGVGSGEVRCPGVEWCRGVELEPDSLDSVKGVGGNRPAPSQRRNASPHRLMDERRGEGECRVVSGENLPSRVSDTDDEIQGAFRPCASILEVDPVGQLGGESARNCQGVMERLERRGCSDGRHVFDQGGQGPPGPDARVLRRNRPSIPS